MSYALGQDDPLVAPPPPQIRDWWQVLGWGLVVATAVGIFWGVTSGPMGTVTANRRRRRTSKRRRRRTTRRNTRRRYPRRSTPSRRQKAAYRKIGGSWRVGFVSKSTGRFVQFPWSWAHDTKREAVASYSRHYRGRVTRKNSRRRRTTRRNTRPRTGLSSARVDLTKEKQRRTAKSRAWERGVEMYLLGMGLPRGGLPRETREGYSDARKSDSYGHALNNPYSGRRSTALQPNLRRYKALSASARRNMPDSYFALSGRRFPVRGPVGSSRERDKWQAMQAIRYLNMGRVKSKRDYLDIRNAIIRRYGMGFWRSYDGPTWPKIQSAKRKRSATRSRRPRRALAANRRRTSRR